jgi:hypothetical protein
VRNLVVKVNNKNMAADFKKYNVGELQTFLKDRGIQLSDDGKRKRKKELIQLCENAEAMKQPKIEAPVEVLRMFRL